jgi:hypothetical protein
MNSLIETIFQDFTVDGKSIPVSFVRYNGKSTTYITYMYYDSDNSFSGDDELLGWVDYYDFDIYSKGNYLNIIESVKSVMKQNGFMFQPSRSSHDMYEADTGYFHRTLSFAKERQENELVNPSL